MVSTLLSLAYGAELQIEHGRYLPHTVDERQSCEPNSLEQNRRVAAVTCDPEYVAAVTNSGLLDCVFQNPSIDDIRQCGTDRGTLCTFYKPFSPTSSEDILDSVREIERDCFEDSTLANTLKNCSSECMTALEEFADRYGCCIHSQNEITGEERTRVLTPLLWSQCGVERPEPCENTPRSPANTAASCSFFCAAIKSAVLQCKHIGSELLQIYEDCGDTEWAKELRQTCGFNDKGRSCGFASESLTTQESELFSAFDKCYRYLSASECTPECRGALESLSDSFGCCVNNRNTTAEENRAEEIDSFVTDPALWAACGVQTPDFCDLPADTRSVYEQFIQCDDTCL